MQRSALCRSRRELSNAYLVAKFGFDTAENEPSKVFFLFLLLFFLFLFFSRASDEWIPRKPKKIFVVWRFAMSVYVTNRLMKKDNAIVCRYASKYNLLILLLVCWRPKIESADRPLNTGSTSNQQDFPDKRLISYRKSIKPGISPGAQDARALHATSANVA